MHCLLLPYEEHHVDGFLSHLPTQLCQAANEFSPEDKFDHVLSTKKLINFFVIERKCTILTRHDL